MTTATTTSRNEAPKKIPTKIHYCPDAARDVTGCGAHMKREDDELLYFETTSVTKDVTCKACLKWIAKWR